MLCSCPNCSPQLPPSEGFWRDLGSRIPECSRASRMKDLSMEEEIGVSHVMGKGMLVAPPRQP